MSLNDMRSRFGVQATRIAEGVRRFLARGRPARLAACVVVALAAVVWLGVVMVVLRFLSIVVLLLAAFWCAWLVAAVWWGPVDEGASRAPWRALRARLRLAFEMPAVDSLPVQGAPRSAEPDQQQALAAFRRSAKALTSELLRKQESVNADTERLQQELAGQIESLRALVASIEQSRQDGLPLASDGERFAPSNGAPPADDLFAPSNGTPAADDLPIDPDLRAAFDDLEADLRLEKIEEWEQVLGEREKRLERRERDLAAFIAETQGRLS